MWQKTVFLLFLSIGLTVHGSITNEGRCTAPSPVLCPQIPKYQLLPQSTQCCHNFTQSYYCSWLNQGNHLTRFLQTLKSWNCTAELENQCKERYYNFNEFTENVYLSFCDQAALREKCFIEIASLVQQQSNSKPFRWETAVLQLETDRLTNEDLFKPCVQIAMYEQDGAENFIEIYRLDFITCELAWTGVNGMILKERNLLLLDFLPSGCRVRLHVTAAILLVLGSIGFVINCVLIATVYFTPTLRHSQYVYKTSIAVSDVVISVLVIPSMINNLYAQANQPVEVIENILPCNTSNKITTLHIKGTKAFTQSYLDAFGIFSFVVFFVSVYTLLLATGDRLYAIMCPFVYRKSNSRRNSKYMTLIVWCIGLIISLIPVFARSDVLHYEVETRMLITMGGDFGVLVLSILFAIPIPLMWILIAVTFVHIKKSGKKSRKFKPGQDRKLNNQEIRMATTLLLMVGTFTLSMMPVAALFIFALTKPFPDLTVPAELDFGFLSTHKNLEWVAFMLLNFNTTWNFFIYNARNKQFRKAFYQCMCKLLLVIGCRSFRDKIQKHPASPARVKHYAMKNIKSQPPRQHKAENNQAGGNISVEMIATTETHL